MVTTRLILTILILSGFAVDAGADQRPPNEWYATAAGDEVDFDEARRAHREVLFGAPAHIGRMLLEQGITLVLGSSWYYFYKDLNATDWDLEPTGSNFGRRFTSLDDVRFDTNRFFVNQGHILAGSVHYAIPRNNEFGVFASLGVGILTSALWEWVFEYREYISLNDLITSPYGGQPLGEVTFKLGELYARQADALPWPARALTFVFAQGRALHRKLGDELPTMPGEMGLAMHHDFRASAGAAVSGTDVAQIEDVTAVLHVQTSVVDLPGYHRVGRFHTFFRDGNFTRLSLTTLIGAKPYFKRFTAVARAELLGYYGQAIDPAGQGWALKLGLGRGSWIDARQQSGLDDLIGIVDVVGPNAELNLWVGRAQLSLGAGVYGDFGSVTSLAYAERAADFAPNTLRSELQEQGYYFGWGMTTTPWLRGEVGRWSVEAHLDQSWFSALGGPDRRHQNDIPTTVTLRDQRTLFAASAGVRLLDRAELTLRFERLRRSSHLDDTAVVRTVDELGATVGYRF